VPGAENRTHGKAIFVESKTFACALIGVYWPYISAFCAKVGKSSIAALRSLYVFLL